MFAVHNLTKIARRRSLIEGDGDNRHDSDQGERGAAMVEYALLLVLVLLVAVFSIAVFGETLVGVFDASNEALSTATGAATGAN